MQLISRSLCALSLAQAVVGRLAGSDYEIKPIPRPAEDASK